MKTDICVFVPLCLSAFVVLFFVESLPIDNSLDSLLDNRNANSYIMQTS